MTFSELKDRLKDLLGRAPAAICYELVTADLNKRLRVDEMIIEDRFTAPDNPLDLPVRFLQIVEAYLDTDPRQVLTPQTGQAVNRQYVSGGSSPKTYRIVSDNMFFDVDPGADDLVLRYYQALENLISNIDTNAVLETYPAVYLYGVLTHHAVLIRDTEAARLHAASWYESISQANGATLRRHTSGGTLQPVAGTGTTP